MGANPIERITTGRVRRTRRMIGNKPLEREKKEEWKRALGELCFVSFSHFLHGKMKIGKVSVLLFFVCLFAFRDDGHKMTFVSF